MTALLKPDPEEVTIRIPYNFEPRWYQVEVMKAFETYKRILMVWHRRCGKDLSCLAALTVPAMIERVGYYLYVYPTSTLGKRAMWRGMDNEGKKFLSRIPEAYIKKQYNSEMLVELTNGSILQIIGSDKIENVGINPVGIILSEFSLQIPTTWEYLRPILRFNKGWAVFNFTPRGKNHAYDLYEMAKSNPKWFVSHLTVEDTQLLEQEDLDEERLEGMSEEMIQQEYFCSFNKGIGGTYYGTYVDKAEFDERVTFVPYEESLPVHVVFDLGMNDANAIWFFQLSGREIRLIDYYENKNRGLQHYAHYLKEKGYVYGDIWFPHDGRVREQATGISRKDSFESMMGLTVQIVPSISLLDGIDCTRRMFARFWFDEKKTATRDPHDKKKIAGLDCLRNYQKEWNDKREEYEDHPKKSKWNHGADSIRYLSIIVDGDLVTANNETSVDEIRSLNARQRRKRA